MLKRLTATAGLLGTSLAAVACNTAPAASSPEVAAAPVASARWDKGATGVSDGVPQGSDAAIPSKRPQ